MESTTLKVAANVFVESDVSERRLHPEIVRIIRRVGAEAVRQNRAVSIRREPSERFYELPAEADEFLALAAVEREPGWFILRNLGLQDEPDRISWKILSYSFPRRVFNAAVALLCLCLPASRLKNSLYRIVGFRIARNVEISQGAFLDTFCPALIEIGEGSMVGAFSKIFSHAYKGNGEVIMGVTRIGRKCRILGLALVGPCEIGDGAIVMANATTIPYFRVIEPDTIVGYQAPPVAMKRTAIHDS